MPDASGRSDVKDNEKSIISSTAAVELKSESIQVVPDAATTDYSSRGRKRKARTVQDSDMNERVTGSKSKEKCKKKDDPESDFDKQWICAECKEAECALDPLAEELLVCEGLCRRLFHFPCVNLKTVPSEDEQFFCSDCTNKRHRCAVCQDFGDDDEDVFKCRRDDCGFFFHQGCLAVRSIEVTYKRINSVDGDGAMDDEEQVVDGTPIFECPAHRCWTCAYSQAPEDGQAQSGSLQPSKKRSRKSSTALSKREELFCCIECPVSYHATCIPPCARFHELALLCHVHAATCKLPDLEEETSLQNAIETKMDATYLGEGKAKIRPRNKAQGQNSFLFGLSGDQLTATEFHFVEKAQEHSGEPPAMSFCLPASVKDDVYSMPPTYRHIQVNKVDPNNAPPRAPTGDPCECKESCRDHCINRLTYTECSAKNCNVGPSCGNRMIGKRQIPKCKVKREKGKGWGLVTLESVEKDALVQEYIGEIIDKVEKEKRLAMWSLVHPNDQNFYIMENVPGWFIDARITSNLSRFINHSCDPNCILTVFNVGGVMRNGIFALRDIKAGEFLSYDYQFDTIHTEKFTCRCGAEKCRGSLQYGAQRKGDSSDKSKGQLWDEARAGYERDKKLIEDYNQDVVQRLSQVAATVPGSSASDELVANDHNGTNIVLLQSGIGCFCGEMWKWDLILLQGPHITISIHTMSRTRVQPLLRS